VEIAGLPPAFLSPSQLIEYVPQLPTLFSRTVLENIMYNRQTIVAGAQLEKDRRAVRALLAELKLANGTLLSGGQRRIICLMRAYFRSQDGRKPLLLLDEPLVNLGLHMREAALQLMRRLVLNRTVIAISHDPKFPSNFKPVRI
jgi:ABC-type multidrug transport system fused ATPase/permease subunit